jgi:hypothetical protein
VIVRESTVPSEAFSPIAKTHCPLTSAAEVALDVVENIVAEVVLTVVVVEPNLGVRTNDAPEIDAIVPVVPPKPRPPKPRPPKPPAPREPVGAGMGWPLNPPEGVPPPLGVRPPKPLNFGQPEVLVTATVVAVICACTVPGLLAVVLAALATETQSPVASEEIEIEETFENTVDVPQAMAAVVVVDCTDAVVPETETTLPETPVKLVANCGRFAPAEGGVAPAPEPPDELLPQPTATNATAARQTADPARRPVATRSARRRLGWDLNGVSSVRSLDRVCSDMSLTS